MGRWSRRLAPRFVEFAQVAGAHRVLDVGCGTGSLSFCLAENPDVAGVTGIDFSKVYIEHANRRNRDARLAFQAGDACALPFSDASFDCTLSMLALQFIPQADRAVREMCRVTRSGGTVAAATWDTRGGFVAYRMIFDTAALVDRNGHQHRARAYTRPLSRPNELARLWHGVGFLDVVQDMLTIRMDFASFTDFWAPAEGKDGPLPEYAGTLDAATKAKLRDMVALAYLDGEADGPRSYAATAWAVKGRAP